MQMTEEELKDNLQKPYSRDTWEKTLRFVFDHVSIYSSPKDHPHSSEKVEVFRQIGEVQLHDGKNLALFELELKDKVNLLRNKVELNKLVSKHIDEDKAHGVLSIFQQGEEDYRFTFTAKGSEYNEDTGEIVTKATDTKRFTYVLGQNESCRTAAYRFYELATKKETAELDDVQEAFSVEKLSKQFFKEYKTHYDSFVNYLVDTPSYFKPIFKADNKSVRDFVKLLLGRIVFIQFLQKKRWMGVPANMVGWHNGDVSFLSNSFKEFSDPDLFYSQFLEPLYYEALNKADRPNHIFEPTGTKVPYLNGGLFEKHTVDTSLVNFPGSYFEKLFDFFDKYNFTIDENDPEEHEVGIDPEMLGHIFENLLEDNKDKGAFYTPKEIVHYMCQESLKEYLKTYLQNQDVWPRDEAKATELENGLARFVQHKEAGDVIEHDAALSTALRDVKICDPAIGSGAFPMGLLNEIFRCVSRLHDASPDKVEKVWGMNSWEPHIVKRNIIQNSIYGVDIEKGAVDIARLRFWLSLITDEPEPTSLPNLDYKIVVGNSLLSKFEGEVITIDWDKINSAGRGMFYLQELQDALREISAKQKDYFNSKVKNKDKLALQIRNLKLKVLKNQLSLDKESYMNKTSEKGGFAPTTKDKKYNAGRQSKILEFDATLRKIETLLKQPEKSFSHFDWKLDFPEVMNENINEKEGFDIVIGNPPYFEVSEVSLKERYQLIYKRVLSGHYDVYIFFFKVACDLLKKDGILSYITPHTYLHYTQFKALRKFLRDEFTLLEITEKIPNVFENAVVDVCMNISKKSEVKLLTSFSSKAMKQGRFETTKVIDISHLDFNESTFDINAIQKLIELERHSNNCRPLGDIVESCQGITVYAGVQGEKINYFRKNDNEPGAVKCLRGRDIFRYENNWQDMYIIYGDHLWCQRKPKFFIEPKIFLRQTSDSLIATYIEEPFYCIDSIHSIISKEKEFRLRYILAILNSKFGNYLYRLLVMEAGKIFAQVKLTFLRKMPIKKSLDQMRIIDLVDKILSQKVEGKPSDEDVDLLDALIFKLYEVGYEEAKDIDPSLSLSKEEYESIEID
jgi:adenine-specific DNA-methyltransferase